MEIEVTEWVPTEEGIFCKQAKLQNGFTVSVLKGDNPSYHCNGKHETERGSKREVLLFDADMNSIGEPLENFPAELVKYAIRMVAKAGNEEEALNYLNEVEAIAWA
jgi:hypothetical protein